MKKYFFFFVSIMTLIGCKKTTSLKNLHYDYYTRTSEIEEQGIVQTKVICDMDVDFSKRVSASSREHHGIDRANVAKEEAYFNAIINNNIDVLVSPIYQIEQNEKTATATVYGFPATYKNPRTKIEALKEINQIEQSAFNKYESIWGNQIVTFGNDTVLIDPANNIRKEKDLKPFNPTPQTEEKTKRKKSANVINSVCFVLGIIIGVYATK